MAFSQQDLDAIDAAIASGELTVTNNGRTVTYRSISELIRARDRIASAITAAASSGSRGTYRFTFQTGRGE